MSLVALGADKTHEFRDWLLKHSDPVGPRVAEPEEIWTPTSRRSPVNTSIDELLSGSSQSSIRDFYNS